ncbi:MAG TPA: sulfite exporter TauE/SafE family protein [Cryomorphaceae bacterium]|jgi:uncharacterized membrane protein YfcA|nr:sulfite exporter TauE/SafE family protein [Flavobacteriales bacterium]HCD47570.1 sulfite exporter TauE/SafE family protein [Cryomorphaceae bacterium]
MYANFSPMVDWFELIALVIGGFAAGLINVVAGNGSAITLPLLMWVGLDANAANATNRVGALFQTTSAIGSLSKTARTKYMMKQSYFIIPPVIIGAIIGANLAVDLPEDLMRITIGSIMILLLITTLTNPKKWLIPTDGSKNKRTPTLWLAYFGLGLYGGFIQMGFGIFFLSISVLLAKYALRDGNIMKLFVAFLMTIPAFIIYAWSGGIDWAYGLTLALGTSMGARFGAKKVVQHKKANAITRKVLIAVIIVAIVKMFQPYIGQFI